VRYQQHTLLELDVVLRCDADVVLYLLDHDWLDVVQKQVVWPLILGIACFFLSLLIVVGSSIGGRGVGVHPYVDGCCWHFRSLLDATQQAHERPRIWEIPNLLIAYKPQGGKGETALGRDCELVPRDGRILSFDAGRSKGNNLNLNVSTRNGARSAWNISTKQVTANTENFVPHGGRGHWG
jgi:hypothetical protein